MAKLYKITGETVEAYGVFGDSYSKVLKKIAKFSKAMEEADAGGFVGFAVDGPTLVEGGEYYATLFVMTARI